MNAVTLVHRHKCRSRARQSRRCRTQASLGRHLITGRWLRSLTPQVGAPKGVQAGSRLWQRFSFDNLRRSWDERLLFCSGCLRRHAAFRTARLPRCAPCMHAGAGSRPGSANSHARGDAMSPRAGADMLSGWLAPFGGFGGGGGGGGFGGGPGVASYSSSTSYSSYGGPGSGHSKTTTVRHGPGGVSRGVAALASWNPRRQHHRVLHPAPSVRPPHQSFADEALYLMTRLGGPD